MQLIANPVDRLGPAQRAWLQATFDRRFAQFGSARMQLDEGQGENDDQDGGSAGGSDGEKPFSELTADEKVEFLLAKTRRLEDQVKGKSPDRAARDQAKRVRELEKQVAEANELKATLEAASQTEAERAVKRAAEEGQKVGREAALAEARKTYGSQLVAVQLDAAAEKKGLTAEQMRSLAGDLSRFLDDEGVDAEAVTTFLGALPDKATEPKQLAPRDLGGGRREGTKLTAFEAGQAESRARRERLAGGGN